MKQCLPHWLSLREELRGNPSSFALRTNGKAIIYTSRPMASFATALRRLMINLRNGELLMRTARSGFRTEDYDGAKRLRNAETGQYALAGDPLATGDNAAGAGSTGQWRIAASLQYDDYVLIASAAGGYLNVDASTDTALASVVDPTSDGAQWLLEDPTVRCSTFAFRMNGSRSCCTRTWRAT